MSPILYYFFLVIFSILFFLYSTIGYAKTLTKAGLSRWGMFIPVYGIYQYYKLAAKWPTYFWISILGGILMGAIGQSFNIDQIPILMLIFMGFIHIYISINIGKNFGFSGFSLIGFVICPITISIIGYIDEVQYIPGWIKEIYEMKKQRTLQQKNQHPWYVESQRGSPAQQAPTQQIPLQQDLLQQNPLQQTPVQETSMQKSPVQEAQTQQVSDHGFLISKTSTQQTAIQQTPIKQAPVQQAPIEQAPVQQAPIEQDPVQQAPIEQAPVQQAPMQQDPIEQKGNTLGSF